MSTVSTDRRAAAERPLVAPERQRLPAALVHVWLRPPVEWDALCERLAAELQMRGVTVVRDGLLAVVPGPGAPEIFDAAARLARAVLAEAGGRAQILILPGLRAVDAAAAVGWHDPLGEALAQRPPELLANAIYLSTHAAHRLEGRFRQMPRGVYQTASGQSIPLVRLGGTRVWDDPRRNVQPLGRTVKAVPRPQPIAALSERWQEPLLSVEGMLGVGKSRLVWEALQAQGEAYAWSVCAGEAAGGSHPLAEQMFAELLGRARSVPGSPPRLQALRRRELLDDPLFLALRIVDACSALRRDDRPFRLVIDSVESATAGDRALIQALCTLPQLGDSVRLILIGRSGTAWPDEAAGSARVMVPALGLAESDALGRQLIHGLSVPDEVLDRFVESAGGNPLALEEGLHALIHRGGLKRIYGSLFFSGDGATRYEPSERWISLVLAEAGRLGDPSPVLALAAADCALPPEAPLERSAGATWPAAYRAAGWLREADTPWGLGFELVSGALGAALRWTLPPAELAALRQSAGAKLAAQRSDGPAGWAAYGLLQGTPAAIPALLSAAREPRDFDRLDDLLGALRRESAAGEPDARLDLLWALLPLAHQHGRLETYANELEIALELAADQPKRLLALGALRAELEESQGRFSDAEGSLRQALESAIARTGQADRKALLSIRLGRVLVRDERFAEARRLFEEIQPLLDRAQRTTLAASCDFYLGNIALHEDRLEEARAYHEVALRTRREKGQRAAAGASLSALGATALAQGFYAEALEHFEEARRTLGDAGDPGFELLGAGRALDRMGDFAGASTLLRQALALRSGKADSTAEAVVRLALAENQLNLDHVDVARRELLQAHFLLSLRSPSRALGDVEALLGRLALRQKQLAEGRAHFRTALDLHRDRHDIPAGIMDLGWYLEAVRLQDDVVEGASIFVQTAAALDRAAYPERGEITDLALFRAAAWLRTKGVADAPDPLPFLQRGYENLVRKMARLSPESRNRYLLQVTANREILQAATQHGVAALA